MSHKAKDMIRLEEYCRAAGLTKKYCKLLGELSLRYYHFSWLPSLLRYCQDSCANLILDKPPGYQIPDQAVAVKVAVHLS